MRILLVTLLALACGCGGNQHWLGSKVGNWFQNDFKVGPNYVEPCAPVADDWIEGYNDRVQHDLPMYDRWWSVFNDPILDALIDEAYSENLTLKAAGFRVLQARALRGISVGEMFPQVQQLTADYIHSQDSQTTRGATGAAPGKRGYDFWSTGINQVWELDVWGKFRRQVESADANLDASIADYDDILVILLADTAASYVEYRTVQERLRLTAANIELQKGSLKISEDRYKNEFVSKLDVTQALTNLERTQATVPRLELLRRNAMLRLCVLTGRTPQDLTDELANAPIPTAPATVAVGIPADLIRRRPDIRRAEREVAVQSAQIGVAVADLFPQLSISGFLGWDSENLSSLFQSSSLAGFVAAPTVNWNVLNYGRLFNNVLLQDAGFQELVLTYQQKVLDAGAEAEQALAGFLRTQEEAEILARAAKANQESVDLVNTQYSGGFVDFNRVFTLQADLVTAQDELAVSQGDIALNLIEVYKSLGGGWQIRCTESPAEIVLAEGVMQPVVEPARPAIEPLQPGTEPAQPGLESTQPAVEPEQPTVEPADAALPAVRQD